MRTPFTRLLLVLTLFAAASTTSAAPPAHASLRGCGVVWSTNPYGTYASFRVKTARLSCRAARGVVKNYWRTAADPEPGDRTRMGRFTCVYLRYWSPPRAAWTCFYKGQRATGYWMPETNA